jgi:hypothetical protein
MTHREQVMKRYNLDKNKGYSIEELAKITKIKKKDLEEVEDRGKGAWASNIRSVRMKGSFKKNVDAPRSAKLSAEQWGMSRLYAFINKLDEIKEGKRKKMKNYIILFI